MTEGESNTHHHSRRRTAEMMLLITTLVWGATFAATKTLLDTMSPMGLLAWRFGLAAIVFCIFFGRRLRWRLTRKELVQGTLLGIFLYAGFLLQTLGLSFTSSSRSGFITSLYVVMTPLLQIIFTRRAPRGNVLAGIGLVLLGLWGLTAPGGTPAGLLEPWREGGFGLGDALTLACALCFAVYIIMLDRFTRLADVVILTAVQLVFMGLASVIIVGLTEPWSFPSGVMGWAQVLYLAIFATVCSTYWQTRYQRDTTPTRAAVIYTMESVFAAIIGTLVLGEVLGPVGIIGGAFIVAGLLVVELMERRG